MTVLHSVSYLRQNSDHISRQMDFGLLRCASRLLSQIVKNGQELSVAQSVYFK